MRTIDPHPVPTLHACPTPNAPMQKPQRASPPAPAPPRPAQVELVEAEKEAEAARELSQLFGRILADKSRVRVCSAHAHAVYKCPQRTCTCVCMQTYLADRTPYPITLPKVETELSLETVTSGIKGAVVLCRGQVR